MLYLLLAILSSALVSVTLRLTQGRVRCEMGMFLTNYICCAALSLAFSARPAAPATGEGSSFALGAGVISGVLYLLGFVLYRRSIWKNGVVLSATYMKLGVLIPTLMAIIAFGERPGPARIVGIALSVAAIIAMYYERDGAQSAKSGLLLIALLLENGVTDSMANIYEKFGDPALKDRYLLITFSVAALCSLALLLRAKEKLCMRDALTGIALGLPNYFSSRFLLLSLHGLPAVVVYPVYSVATIALVSLVGMAAFGERLSRRKLIAIAVIIAALVLINLP